MVATLEQLAALARIRGDTAGADVFSRAAAATRARHILSERDLERFLNLPDAHLDPDVAGWLRYFHDAGAATLIDLALADLPADLRWLIESGAATIDQAAAIHDALGTVSIGDFAEAVRRNAIRRLPDLGIEVERAIAAALPTLRPSSQRIPIGRAVAITEPIVSWLQNDQGIRGAQAVGSLRRGDDTVGNLDIMAPVHAPDSLFDEASRLPAVSRVRYRACRRLYLVVDRTEVEIRCPDPAVTGTLLLHLTGSAAHVNALRALAADRGCRLEPEGLITAAGSTVTADSEEGVYAALGLAWIPPELRSGDDEVAMARDGALPRLVEHSEIRGDLHMHTTFSDGRDTVEGMVRAASSLDYEYVAITDHSPHCASSRRLSLETLKRQSDEIAALREQFPRMTILHGCEVDILPDGTLDFDDRVLEGLDIVLASLHNRAGDSRERLLSRYLGAMRHPLVTLITHPANRAVPHYAGYDIDYDRLFDVAAETGTLVEIDGAAGHLDMDGTLARRAVSAGASIAIDSDCHRADLLERYMRLGVTMARRGRVEARHVVNTRPPQDLLARIREKRR